MSGVGAKVQADADKALRLYKDVSRITVDDECLFFCVEDLEFTAVLPEVYGQQCDVYGPGDFEISCSGTIVDIVSTVLRRFDFDAMDAPATPASKAARHSSAASDDVLSECDMSEVVEGSTKCFEELRKEVEELDRRGIGCSIGAVLKNEARVTLSIPVPGEITRYTAEAWGLDREKPLRVSLSVNQAHYARGTSERLDVVFFQEKTTSGFEKLDAAVQLSNIAAGFWRHICGIASADPPPDGACGEAGCGALRLREKKAEFCRCAMQSHGVLLPFAKYMQARLPCLHEYCVICDEPLVFPPLLRPTVCTRTLCSYSARTFGEAVTGEFSGQNANLEVWDLLVSMAICAGQMPADRMEALFDVANFPLLFPPGSTQPAFVRDAAGFKRLRALLAALARHRARRVASSGVYWFNEVFSRSEDLEDSLLPAAVGWIWDSNRSYMVALAEETRISALSTPYQYLLLSAPPEMEERFQALKTQHGSDFCFHGSAPANWHSILRLGLRNASGTSLMTAGQAHGPGIYLGRQSHVSAAYSGRALVDGFGPIGGRRSDRHHDAPKAPSLDREVTGQRVHDPDSLVMLAICEVAKVPTLKQPTSHIWVCPDEAAVVTRFFLVYSRQAVPSIDMGCKDLRAQLVSLTERWTST